MEPSISIDTPRKGASEAPSRERRPLPWRARLTAIFGVLATLAFASWMVLRLAGHEEPGEVVRPRLPLGAVANAALIVDAAPWGQVQQILGPGGLPHPPPADAVTPLVLELPPGKYRIDLAGPPGSAPRSCEVELTPASAARCRVSFARLEPVDYFREAGWWN